jgi:hypothetical protein
MSRTKYTLFRSHFVTIPATILLAALFTMTPLPLSHDRSHDRGARDPSVCAPCVSASPVLPSLRLYLLSMTALLALPVARYPPTVEVTPPPTHRPPSVRYPSEPFTLYTRSFSLPPLTIPNPDHTGRLPHRALLLVLPPSDTVSDQTTRTSSRRKGALTCTPPREEMVPKSYWAIFHSMGRTDWITRYSISTTREAKIYCFSICICIYA